MQWKSIFSPFDFQEFMHEPKSKIFANERHISVNMGCWRNSMFLLILRIFVFSLFLLANVRQISNENFWRKMGIEIKSTQRLDEMSDEAKIVATKNDRIKNRFRTTTAAVCTMYYVAHAKPIESINVSSDQSRSLSFQCFATTECHLFWVVNEKRVCQLKA